MFKKLKDISARRVIISVIAKLDKNKSRGQLPQTFKKLKARQGVETIVNKE